MEQGADINQLLDCVLHLTRRIKQTLLDPASDPETWPQLLEQRQEAMDQLSALFSQGVSITEEQKAAYLKPAYEDDLHIGPLIRERKRKLESDFAQLQRSKQANQQYMGYGLETPYGAFFDKKK